MSRTLIQNTSAEAQTLPAIYGSFTVAVGHGRVVADESALVVSELGGFAAMDGKWAVSAISTDTALGDFDIASNGLALLATFVPGGQSRPVSWNNVQDKPAFASVALSGSYGDLINKPALADVATSGSYADLSAKPAIPAASNATATDVSTTGAAGVGSTYARGDHQHAHGSLSGGDLHSNATTIADGFMSALDKSKLDDLADVALSGSYNDLTDAPALAPVATSGDYADLNNAPDLALVATSGDYADLANKPAKTYDMGSYAAGALSVGSIIAQVYAAKALTLTGLSQTGGATVVAKVNGVNATYPKAVAIGQLISIVVTATGVNNTWTLSAVEA